MTANRFWVDFCVNDPDNGMPDGYVVSIHIGEMLKLYGVAIFSVRDNRLWLDGLLGLPILKYREWVGNWCWDAALLDKQHVARLLNWLRASGWELEEAYQTVWDRWEGSKPFLPGMLDSLDF